MPGTLDPMATGLLIILVGKATRVSQYLISLDKEYEGTIELGKVTDTQDADGEVMETRPVPPLTEAQVKTAIQTFLGDQYQTPPMYSAIKIDGVPLYKSARKGEEVEREPRFIRVMTWELTRFALPQLGFSAALHQGHVCADAGARFGPEARLRRASFGVAADGDGQVQRFPGAHPGSDPGHDTARNREAADCAARRGAKYRVVRSLRVDEVCRL